MPKKDPRVDAYIAKAAPFAKPILNHLRALVPRGCPDARETIKWGFPHFEHGGILCSMAAFKAHCAFGFWNRKFLTANPEAMGHFGRITSVADLPSDEVIVEHVREAARLNAAGERPRRERAAPKKELPPPPDLSSALRKNARARATFEGFSPSRRREYVEWIMEAKTEETRAKRLATAVEWMAEGKSRNWKYEETRRGEQPQL